MQSGRGTKRAADGCLRPWFISCVVCLHEKNIPHAAPPAIIAIRTEFEKIHGINRAAVKKHIFPASFKKFY